MLPRQHAEIAGRRFAWLQAGQGEPIIVLHAFPVHADMWQPQLDAVPHGWRLIAPDLRGFGESSGPPALSVDDHAEDVLALMRHLNIERAVIGGLSMGGYITFALYRRAAQRFRAMVLADTRPEADTEEARAGRVAMQQSVREKGAAAAADAMVPKLLGPHSTSPVRDRVRELILSNGAPGIIDALEALKTRPDSTATLALITCPTLIIVGQDDAVTPVAVADAMRERIAAATKAVIPAAGHLSNVEQPQAFNAALWEFVQKRLG
jgi:3-oxoadipate enol-lactonase